VSSFLNKSVATVMPTSGPVQTMCSVQGAVEERPPTGCSYHTSLPSLGVIFEIKVGFSSDEILATISVHVDPVSHMVEVAIFVACHCLSFSSFADIIRIHSDDVNSTVALSRNKEAIRYNDGARLIPKDVTRDDLDVIGPFEVTDVFNLNRFKFAHSFVFQCCS